MSKLAEEIAEEAAVMSRRKFYEGRTVKLKKDIAALIDEKLSGVRKSAKTLLGVTSIINPEDAMLIKNMHESLRVD